jgi:hypothetical protein
VGSSTSHNPIGLHGLLRGQLYFIFYSEFQLSCFNLNTCVLYVLYPGAKGYSGTNLRHVRLLFNVGFQFYIKHCDLLSLTFRRNVILLLPSLNMFPRLFYAHLLAISNSTQYQRALLIIQQRRYNFSLRLPLLLLLLIIWIPGTAGMSGICNLRRIL